MDHSVSNSINRPRRSSSRVAAIGHSNGRMDRRDSNLSISSFLDDVEMAHDEVGICSHAIMPLGSLTILTHFQVFAGPMSER